MRTRFGFLIVVTGVGVACSSAPLAQTDGGGPDGAVDDAGQDDAADASDASADGSTCPADRQCPSQCCDQGDGRQLSLHGGDNYSCRWSPGSWFVPRVVVVVA